MRLRGARPAPGVNRLEHYLDRRRADLAAMDSERRRPVDRTGLDPAPAVGLAEAARSTAGKWSTVAGVRFPAVPRCRYRSWTSFRRDLAEFLVLEAGRKLADRCDSHRALSVAEPGARCARAPRSSSAPTDLAAGATAP